MVAASAGMAAPALASPGVTTPSVSIVSAGNPVAVGQDLSIDKVVVRNNGTTSVTEADVQFDLVPVSRSDFPPFDFGQSQTDPSCQFPPSTLPSYTQACHYPVQIAPGATADFAVKLRLSPSSASAASAPMLLRITVGSGADADSTTVGPIDRVKRQADISVRVAGPLKGRVGDTVDVTWTVTNKGPDALPDVQFIFTAPTGTEWTGAAAHQCDPPAIPNTKYYCVSDGTVAVGGEISETWQLKIDSAAVGTGQILVTSDLNAGQPPDPYLEIIDPNPADNTVDLTVEVDTSTSGPTTSPSATPTPTPVATGGVLSPAPVSASPTPVTPVALPKTGMDSALIAAIAGIALATGVLLVFVAGRRRSRTLGN
jgi:LPXTG-motif cell wall-anchored protein